MQEQRTMAESRIYMNVYKDKLEKMVKKNESEVEIDLEEY
jgi:hypothetical protein